MQQKSIYARRRFLRSLEKGWTAVERAIDRLTRITVRTKPFNPLYYLGQLAILLLIILTITGIYLTIFYRPGADRAYQSVVLLGGNWFGNLMRTSHRYASDALIFVILLHALKTLLSDRFWGSRWLAWVTGWLLLALTWSLGVMGYWLVWDTPAQWLTEWATAGIGGPLAYSFFGPNVSSATFALFVIVLFLHVFLPPLLGVGVIIHVLRVARARYWTPRWLVWLTVLALLIISLLLPVDNGLPANFEQMLGDTRLDWLYLGFLPVAEQLGSLLTWGVTIMVVAVLTALPWLWRGQHEGPAEVIAPACTGCGACVVECPYAAIDLLPRDDESGYSSLALVKPDLCTGCGICVGSCPDKAIELDRLPSPVVRQDLQRRLGQMAQMGEPAVTIYACDRHHALGTLPTVATAAAAGMQVPVGETIPLLQAKLPPRISVGTWPDAEGVARPVMTAVVPCSGMLHPNWASETLAAGGAGAIVVSCPAGDCAHREGPHWIGKRLVRRQTLRRGNTHFLEIAPGSQTAVRDLWLQMIGDEAEMAQARADLSTVGIPKAKIQPPTRGQQVRHLLPGLLILLVVLGLSLLPTWRVARNYPASAGVQLVLNHNGRLMAESNNLPPDIAEKLPPNVDPATILGGQRFPVQVRLLVDGDVAWEEVFEPGGLRGEGTIYAAETHWLTAGDHHIVVEMNDDGAGWRAVFDEMRAVEPDVVLQLLWQEDTRQFVIQN